MQAKASSSSHSSRKANRAGRPLRRRRRLDPEHLYQGMVWVVNGLLERHQLSPTRLARECGVGPQSVRDYLKGLHLYGRHTVARMALWLGYFPDEVEKLTRRWMRKYRHREKRRHADDPTWRLRYPWELSVLLHWLGLLL